MKTDKEKGGPVYSEIGDQVAPPPPSINRMPLYHQEIDKDMVAIVSCDIGEPCYQQDCLEQEGKNVGNFYSYALHFSPLQEPFWMQWIRIKNPLMP